MKKVKRHVLEVLADGEGHDPAAVADSAAKAVGTQYAAARETIRSMIAAHEVVLTIDWKIKLPKEVTASKPVQDLWSLAAAPDPLLEKLGPVLKTPLTPEQKEDVARRVAEIRARVEEDLKPYVKRPTRRCKYCGR